MDYVNIELSNINIELLESKREILDFKHPTSKSTGHVDERLLIAKYNFCTIEIKTVLPDEEHPNREIKKFVTFKGSIHKMWNELNGLKAPNYKENKPYNGYNGNQFTINDIFEVRKHLEKLFSCNSNQMIIHGVEFGVNTTINFNPKLFVKGLLYHYNSEFEFSHFKNTAKSKHQRWNFKIYSKSFQYDMIYDVLRVELQINRMEEINCEFDSKGEVNKDYVGIKTFEDVNENTLKKAKELLLSRFDQVMYYDYTINKKNFSKSELINIKDYSRPNYWIVDLKSNHRDRPKKKLKSLIINNSDNLHQQIRDNIIEKCVINNRLVESGKCVINNPILEVLFNTQIEPTKTEIIYTKKESAKNLLCKVTGFDISMQKENSIYLSHTGLKYIYENDLEKFENLKKTWLPIMWTNSNFQTQILKMAHQIRLGTSNQKVRQIRIYQPQQTNILTQLGI